MARIAADPVTQAWWKLTDAMQEPFDERPAGAWWLTIPEVFHTD
jgi:L-rhamnose mutarotase